MKVNELAGERRVLDIPDEWGETAKNIKELIPSLKAANAIGKTVHISLTSDGAFSVSVSNYSDTPVGGTWHYYTEYTGDDGYELNYVSEYTKEEA